MINYIKSENYRLFRKKGLHITSLICLLLIIFSAATLYYFGQHEPNFPYATSLFFYSNVIGSSILILIIAFLFNLALTGKDMSLIKQSISFGISRNTIFWSKLILTLSYFLVICVVGLLLMIGLGENLFVKEEQSVSNFLIASFNMLPIVLSGFFMIHAMKMMKAGEVYIIIMLLFFFVFSGDLLRLILRPISGLDELYQYAPSTQFNENLMSFMDQSTQFEFRYWITGIVISVICLLIGARKFAKQYID
ncbi:ABC-2 type transport system permease protein [Virgibacillus halotolerans]|uniref:ABC transporter permease n=1 Tax=Virgibacillus halotolerans TaxID=1071053 RepID=UPI00195F3C78|nr:ABC transporter permease [Virgibacillus halotolerans]MBM7601554.1 ABC-2 type transport system permease protein [Virgibacillus halotolerans]